MQILFQLHISTLLVVLPMIVAGVCLEIWTWPGRKLPMALLGGCSDYDYFLLRVQFWGLPLVCWGLALLFSDSFAGSSPLVSAGTWSFFLGVAAMLIPRFLVNMPSRIWVTKGALFQRFEELCGDLRGRRPTVLVLTSKDAQCRSARPPKRRQIVAVPQRFLEWMSRAEIDTLVASQLAGVRIWYHLMRAAMTILVSCSIPCIVLIALQASLRVQWAVTLLVLAVEVAALSLFGRRMRRLAYRYIIELTGDPEAYLSAMVEVYRLSDRAVGERLVSRIAGFAGLTEARVLELRVQVRPSVDRYLVAEDDVEAVA